MRLKKSILALGAFFVAAISLSACGGSSVPGNSVAAMSGNPITMQAFNHWMYVAAEGNAAQSPGAPVIVPTDPPDFNDCIAQVRKQVPSLKKTSDKTLKTDCGELFTSLSTQVMDFLIRAYWYQAQAARLHVNVTNAEVQKAFTTDKQQAYPTEAQFQAFLKQSGQTLDDIVYRVKVNLIYMKLINQQLKKVTAADISNYYNAHKSQFGSAQKRNIRIVLAQTQADAEAAKAALEKGESWDTVAKKYSTDPTTKNSGGLLKNVSEGQEDSALNNAAFAAPANKLLGPIKGQFGYYVFEVTGITPATQQSLQQATSTISQTLTSQAQTNAQNAVDAAAKKQWLHQTSCRSDYAMADCSGYKAPKSSSSTTTGSASTG
jgi:foldase protein PrsA